MELEQAKSTSRTPFRTCSIRDTLDSGLIILESTHYRYGLGSHSIICRHPYATITGCGPDAEISIDGSTKSIACTGPADLINIIQELSHQIGGEPFAAGYIGYEFACRSLSKNLPAVSKPDIPEYGFGIYKSVAIYDHLTESWSCTNQDEDDYTDLLTHLERESTESFDKASTSSVRFQADISRVDYISRIKRIKEYIREGDIYQANMTNRFSAVSSLPGYDCYWRLRRLNPASYSAYMNFGDFEILSSSPERLICKNGNIIETRPIKGTRPRGKNRQEDERLKAELLNSTKDRAELLMITDLSRNDLGRVARPGSVHVPVLRRLESYSSVHHLVSEVRAELDDNKTPSDLMEAILPGGSITGAPKKRAVEILNQLEDVPRQIYTGSIGFIHKGDLDFNIAIRTILKKGDSYFVNAGGGIVADSDPDEEYREMLTKAANLFAAVADVYEIIDD